MEYCQWFGKRTRSKLSEFVRAFSPNLINSVHFSAKASQKLQSNKCRWPVVGMVGLVDVFSYLRWWNYAADTSLSQSKGMQRGECSLSHMQYAALSGATGISGAPVCRLQWCAIRWHTLQMDTTLRLRGAVCANVQVRFYAKSPEKNASTLLLLVLRLTWNNRCGIYTCVTSARKCSAKKVIYHLAFVPKFQLKLLKCFHCHKFMTLHRVGTSLHCWCIFFICYSALCS